MSQVRALLGEPCKIIRALLWCDSLAERNGGLSVAVVGSNPAHTKCAQAGMHASGMTIVLRNLPVGVVVTTNFTSILYLDK